MNYHFPHLANLNFNISGCNFYANPNTSKPERKQLKEPNFYTYEKEEESPKKYNDIVRVENENGKKTYVIKYTPGATITIGGRKIHFK